MSQRLPKLGLTHRRLLQDLWLLSTVPTYRTGEVYSHLMRFKNAPTLQHETPYVTSARTLQMLTSRLEVLIREIPNPLLKADEESFLKGKFGPQGGVAPWALYRDHVAAYCNAPELTIPAGDYTPVFRSMVSKILSGARRNEVVPLDLLNYLETKATYRGMKRSNSGIRCWGDRRKPYVLLEALTDAFTHPDDYDPVVFGERLQRGKLRAIFMDTLANLFRINRSLRPLHDLLLQSDVPSWRGDHADEAKFHAFIQKYPNFWSLEADADSMDIRMHEESSLFDIQGLLSLLPHTARYREAMERVVHKVYHMRLLTPDGLDSSKKKLLSGLPPTNDLESVRSWFLMESEILYCIRVEDGCPLSSIPHEIFVKGDDVSVLFAEDIGEILLRAPDGFQVQGTPTEVTAAWYEHWHIRAKPEKQGYRQGTMTYCKRYYYRGISQYSDPDGNVHQGSVYPLAMALNAIVYPEELFNPSNVNYHVCRIFQICDNARFHPMWKAFVRLLVDTGIIPIGIKLTEADALLLHTEQSDWRWWLYGEQFTLASSATYQYLVAAGLIES